MEVLAFQVSIFLIIFVASVISKTARNIAVILTSLFTITMVFTNGLMIVQFITIVIATIISSSFSSYNKSINKQKKTSDKSNLFNDKTSITPDHIQKILDQEEIAERKKHFDRKIKLVDKKGKEINKVFQFDFDHYKSLNEAEKRKYNIAFLASIRENSSDIF